MPTKVTPRTAPTGPMLRVLRRMLTANLMVARVGFGELLYSVGGQPVPAKIALGIIARNVVEATDDSNSEYALTTTGKKEAQQGGR